MSFRKILQPCLTSAAGATKQLKVLRALSHSSRTYNGCVMPQRLHECETYEAVFLFAICFCYSLNSILVYYYFCDTSIVAPLTVLYLRLVRWGHHHTYWLFEGAKYQYCPLKMAFSRQFKRSHPPFNRHPHCIVFVFGAFPGDRKTWNCKLR